MVTLKKKKVNTHTYYYLEHSFRKEGRVEKKEQYLGTTPPKNIDQIKEEFLREFYQETWFVKFYKIKEQFTREKRKIPQSIKKKEMDQFSIQFTYASNRIEGSTLTLRETALLLEKGITPSKKPLKDVKEAENHRNVFYDMLSYQKEISLATLLHWHTELFGDTQKEIAGKIRTYPIAISGSTFQPPYAIELDLLLTQFFDWYKKNRKRIHPVYLAALVHLRFVSIP